MYVLLLLSIAAVAIAIDKYRSLKIARKANAKIASLISQQEKLDNVRAILRVYGIDSPLGVMLDKLYNSEDVDMELVKESMETAAESEILKLEKGMGWLSTIAAIAPLIGFLGTVTGMVRVFMNIQGQSQNGIDINILAGGIWEALITTVGGLIVGIVAIVLYNDLVQHLENFAKDMQEKAVEHLVRYQKIER
ncbi:MAG TPA: MotA/TolQ/ExbB proton channel family protein [Candidatus Cloacimonetes bacterium]|nr:biopolymer transporter ExbB [Candidatus Cloacimonas sp.]HHZ14879.1 MotA/TolQ/ExbB proton channel family protein [Candidatus Cloacimonadota bacterium]